MFSLLIIIVDTELVEKCHFLPEMQIMNRIDDKNDWNDIDCMLNAGKRALIPDHQFIKTVQECGRSLLNSSKRPAAITVRKDAAQTLIHTFKEKFGITYTENQIFKKFYNMKQRLRSRLNKKEPLTVSEELLKKLLDEEELRSELGFFCSVFWIRFYYLFNVRVFYQMQVKCRLMRIGRRQHLGILSPNHY